MSTNSTANPVKFTFDEAFGEAREEVEEDRHAEELEAVRAEAEEARRQAYNQGIEDGRQQGHQAAVDALEAQIAQTLQAVSQALADLMQQHGAVVDRMEQACAKLSHDMACMLAPAAMRRFPEDTVTTVLAQALNEAREAPSVALRVPPDLAEPINERLEGIKADLGFDGEVALRGDPSLQLGDARVEWPNGGAEFSSDRMREAVSAAVDSLIKAVDAPGEDEAITAEAQAAPVEV